MPRFKLVVDCMTGASESVPCTPEEEAAADAALAAEHATLNIENLYPVDLWGRMTNEEVEQAEAFMATQPVRIQNIFRYASSYRSDHELWPLLNAMATSLYGAPRASQILAPS